MMLPSLSGNYYVESKDGARFRAFLLYWDHLERRWYRDRTKTLWSSCPGDVTAIQIGETRWEIVAIQQATECVNPLCQRHHEGPAIRRRLFKVVGNANQRLDDLLCEKALAHYLQQGYEIHFDDGTWTPREAEDTNVVKTVAKRPASGSKGDQRYKRAVERGIDKLRHDAHQIALIEKLGLEERRLKLGIRQEDETWDFEIVEILAEHAEQQTMLLPD